MVLQQLPSAVAPVSTGASISVSNLSKTYRILRQEDRDSYASEALIKRLRGKKKQVEEFDALHDVSFDVGWGEVVGIIGRNGAGKSTLLKIINRITAPTTGRIELGGRVGSLLEVGTGFHPELTGRENVFLNGTLLGMRRKEIADRFDAIVEFAGTERFLDTQVKRYSTGMYIRLAFAVAAHLDSEILVVDEVLAVGDSDFQAKCLRKMREVARDGRTVLLVSHQLQTVSDLCTSALYLSGGQLVLHGTVEEALEEYKRSFARDRPPAEGGRPPTGYRGDPLHRGGGGRRHHQARTGRGGGVHRGGQPRPSAAATTSPASSTTRTAWSSPSATRGWSTSGSTRPPTPRAGWCSGPPGSSPGAYTVDCYVYAGGRATDIWEQACHFQVLPVTPYPHPTTPDGTDHGVVYPDFDYSQN